MRGLYQIKACELSKRLSLPTHPMSYGVLISIVNAQSPGNSWQLTIVVSGGDIDMVPLYQIEVVEVVL